MGRGGQKCNGEGGTPKPPKIKPKINFQGVTSPQYLILKRGGMARLYTIQYLVIRCCQTLGVFVTGTVRAGDVGISLPLRFYSTGQVTRVRQT